MQVRNVWIAVGLEQRCGQAVLFVSAHYLVFLF